MFHYLNAKRVILVVLLVLVLGGVWWLLSRPAAPPLSSGTIETDEVHVASRYGGRVIKIYAQEGDSLRPGQPIADLDATELTARRDFAAAALAEMEHGPRSNEIENAKQAWQSVQADLEQARLDEKRTKQLFAENAVSRSEFDNASSRAVSLAKRADAAKAQYDLLVEGTRPERIAQARAQLAEIDEQLKEMKVTTPISELRSPISDPASPNSELRSPNSAFVLEVLSVKVGDVLPANREVATLLLSNHLWVRVYVPETWLGLIQVGEQVKVRTDSSPGREFTGVVEQIARQAEFTPRNVQTVEDRVRQVFGVKVRLPVETGLLRAGMSVDVLFPNVPPPPR